MSARRDEGCCPWRYATEHDLEWWRAARFGMFIHWGPASICGGDISWCRAGEERRGDHQFVREPCLPAATYDLLYRQFEAPRFDADEWVAIAQAAGMKYMVLTAKHHDGFCLFDSRYTSHKVTAPDCPCGRDIVGELADACHAAGMRFGIYYSQRDWYHPDYLTARHDRYLAYYHSQVLELLTKYGKVDVLWFDHIGGTHDQWDPDLVLRTARALQPGLLVNDRLHRAVHYGNLPDYVGDFDTPEQELGTFNTDRAWESCLCLVGGVWSFTPDGEMMRIEQCIRSLLSCAGGDGNLLLNTGPMPDGRIEPRQAARLREIGEWLATYGECVYGTRGGPYLPGDWGVSTHRGTTVYLCVFESDRSELVLPAPRGSILRSRSLDDRPVFVECEGDRLRIIARPSGPATVIAMELDQPVITGEVWRAV